MVINQKTPNPFEVRCSPHKVMRRVFLWKNPARGKAPVLLQVFWLMDPSTRRTFPLSQWSQSAFVPIHSGRTATDSHRLPYYPSEEGQKNLNRNILRSRLDVNTADGGA